MGVVQESVKDVEGLHCKLERKSHVESRNADTAAQFQQRLHAQLQAMGRGLEGFCSTQQQFCRDFSGKIGA